VVVIQNGSERIHPASLRRFTERFARFNLQAKVIRPSYGLAEATVYVATRRSHRRSASSIPTPAPSVRRERPARSGCTAATSRWGIGGNLARPKVRSVEGLWLHRLAHPMGLG
jgi:acyl-CoA synthetase (AMP-forming)/AMP-acid ligase II